MSRYLTFKAARNIPKPVARIVINSTKRGKMAIVQRTGMPCHAISTPRISDAIAKSTSAANTAAPGMIILGKYTFVIRVGVPTRLLALLTTAFAKNPQSKSPA